MGTVSAPSPLSSFSGPLKLFNTKLGILSSMVILCIITQHVTSLLIYSRYQPRNVLYSIPNFLTNPPKNHSISFCTWSCLLEHWVSIHVAGEGWVFAKITKGGYIPFTIKYSQSHSVPLIS